MQPDHSELKKKLQASQQSMLENMRSNFTGEETQRWMNNMDGAVPDAAETIVPGRMPTDTPTSMPEFMDKLFDQLQRYAFELGKAQGRTFHCERPGQTRELVRYGTAYRYMRGHVTGGPYAMIFHAMDAEIQVFFVPTDLMVGFAPQNPDHGYEPHLVLTKTTKLDRGTWAIEGEAFPLSQLSKLARRLITQLTRVSLGEASSDERFRFSMRELEEESKADWDAIGGSPAPSQEDTAEYLQAAFDFRPKPGQSRSGMLKEYMEVSERKFAAQAAAGFNSDRSDNGTRTFAQEPGTSPANKSPFPVPPGAMGGKAPDFGAGSFPTPPAAFGNAASSTGAPAAQQEGRSFPQPPGAIGSAFSTPSTPSGFEPLEQNPNANTQDSNAQPFIDPFAASTQPEQPGIASPFASIEPSPAAPPSASPLAPAGSPSQNEPPGASESSGEWQFNVSIDVLTQPPAPTPAGSPLPPQPPLPESAVTRPETGSILARLASTEPEPNSSPESASEQSPPAKPIASTSIEGGKATDSSPAEPERASLSGLVSSAGKLAEPAMRDPESDSGRRASAPPPPPPGGRGAFPSPPPPPPGRNPGDTGAHNVLPPPPPPGRSPGDTGAHNVLPPPPPPGASSPTAPPPPPAPTAPSFKPVFSKAEPPSATAPPPTSDTGARPSGLSGLVQRSTSESPIPAPQVDSHEDAGVKPQATPQMFSLESSPEEISALAGDLVTEEAEASTNAAQILANCDKAKADTVGALQRLSSDLNDQLESLQARGIEAMQANQFEEVQAVMEQAKRLKKIRDRLHLVAQQIETD